MNFSFALVENFLEFEENLVKNAKKNRIIVIFFFNTTEEANNFLTKFSQILEKFTNNFDYFYYITYLVALPESELREKVFLSPPCVLVYFEQKKYIEMTLDLMGENLYQMLKKLENNCNCNSEKRRYRNSSENIVLPDKKYNMDQVNEKFFKFIEKMLKRNFIIEKEYFFLKSLFFQETHLIINNCYDALM